MLKNQKQKMIFKSLPNSKDRRGFFNVNKEKI